MRRTLLLLTAIAGCQSLDVISFATTTQAVTGGTPFASETDSVQFVAVMTEDNGDDDDLNGGALTDTTGATYGAFQAMAPGGPYVLTLTFEQINQVVPIDFLAPAGERTFVAQFYDDDSDQVTRTASLELVCRLPDGTPAGACNGICSDVQADAANCGGCGHTCEPGQTCNAGTCEAGSG